MKFTGYIFPNLIFFLLIVLAWINIDWARQQFPLADAVELPSANNNLPDTILYAGRQKYQTADTSYDLAFSRLEVYPDKSIRADEPQLLGTNAKGTYNLRGEELATRDSIRWEVTGAPARFEVTVPGANFSGNGGKIDYHSLAQSLLITPLADEPSQFSLYDHSNPQQPMSFNGEAISINYQSQQERLYLNGQARLTYHRDDGQLLLVGENAVFDRKLGKFEIDGGIAMELAEGETTNSAVADHGIYYTNGSLTLEGDVEIQEGARTIRGEKIHYNTRYNDLQVLARQNNQRSSEPSPPRTPASDKIEIIIPH